MLRVLPIVEGHGEVGAVPPLVRRICGELFGAYDTEVLQPLRQPKTRIVSPGNLQRYTEIAANKLRAARPAAHGLVLVMVDADDDLPCLLGPALLASARAGCGDQGVACVIANVEFETWFVAAAASLGDYLRITPDDAPEAPEAQRLRKKWVEDRFKGVRYSETLDQPRLAAKMDLNLCRARSPSFDKLCRELERALAAAQAMAPRLLDETEETDADLP